MKNSILLSGRKITVCIDIFEKQQNPNGDFARPLMELVKQG
ncbi:hypothetical protein [Marnyiella aurantia]|nr:hypothetical protein [Marnyiella aurantia]